MLAPEEHILRASRSKRGQRRNRSHTRRVAGTGRQTRARGTSLVIQYLAKGACELTRGRVIKGDLDSSRAVQTDERRQSRGLDAPALVSTRETSNTNPPSSQPGQPPVRPGYDGLHRPLLNDGSPRLLSRSDVHRQCRRDASCRPLGRDPSRPPVLPPPFARTISPSALLIQHSLILRTHEETRRPCSIG